MKEALHKITDIKQNKDLLAGLLFISWIIILFTFYFPLFPKTAVKGISAKKLPKIVLTSTPKVKSSTHASNASGKSVFSNANSIPPTVSQNNSSTSNSNDSSDTTGSTATTQVSSSNNTSEAEAISTITPGPTIEISTENNTEANPTPTQDPNKNNAIVSDSVNTVNPPGSILSVEGTTGVGNTIQVVGASTVSQAQPGN